MVRVCVGRDLAAAAGGVAGLGGVVRVGCGWRRGVGRGGLGVAGGWRGCGWAGGFGVGLRFQFGLWFWLWLRFWYCFRTGFDSGFDANFGRGPGLDFYARFRVCFSLEGGEGLGYGSGSDSTLEFGVALGFRPGSCFCADRGLGPGLCFGTGLGLGSGLCFGAVLGLGSGVCFGKVPGFGCGSCFGAGSSFSLSLRLSFGFAQRFAERHHFATGSRLAANRGSILKPADPIAHTPLPT